MYPAATQLLVMAYAVHPRGHTLHLCAAHMHWGHIAHLSHHSCNPRPPPPPPHTHIPSPPCSNVLPLEVDLGRDFTSSSPGSALRALFSTWSLEQCLSW
jgi:hypothetical protein